MAYEQDTDEEIAIDDVAAPAAEATVLIDPESSNLAEDLSASEEGKAILKEIAEQVCEDFDEAYESSEEYRAKVADNYKIYSGFLPPKMKPFENCSNVHIPIMLEGVSRLEARTYAEVFLTGAPLLSATPVEPGEIAQIEAAMVTKHSDWQFTEKIVDFRRQMQRACHLFYNVGDFTVHSFYDERLRSNRHEVLTVDDFYTPYSHVSTMPDYSDVPYKIKLLRYRKNDLLKMKKAGWVGVDAVIKREAPGYDGEIEDKLRTSIAEAEGLVAPDSSTRNGQYKLYHYDGSFQFPDDDEARPITAIVDSETKTVMRLFIREEVDWQDQIRFDRQVKERADFLEANEQFMVAAQNYPMVKAEYDAFAAERQMAVAALSQTLDEQEQAAMDVAMQADDPGPPREPVAPIAPGWMEIGIDPITGAPVYPEPAPPRRVPMEMFSHAICMENMLGTLGLSPGGMYADMNRAANNTFNQLSDSATFANVGSYITSDLVDFEAGEFEFGPGVINRLTGISPEMVKDALVPVRVNPANPQLGEITDKIYQWSQTAFGATAALSGEPGKSGETFRGFSSRVEQALKQLSVTGKKFVEGIEQVVKNNCKLNSMFLPDEEIVYVSGGEARGLEKVEVTRKMYQRNYRIKIRADMRFASQQQRVIEADQVLALPQAVPPLQGNLAFYHAAAVERLKAQGASHMIDTLGPPPPAPTTPLGVPPPPPPGMMPPGMAPPPGAGAPPPPGKAMPKPPGIPGPKQAGE